MLYIRPTSVRLQTTFILLIMFSFVISVTLGNWGGESSVTASFNVTHSCEGSDGRFGIVTTQPYVQFLPWFYAYI